MAKTKKRDVITQDDIRAYDSDRGDYVTREKSTRTVKYHHVSKRGE